MGRSLRGVVGIAVVLVLLVNCSSENSNPVSPQPVTPVKGFGLSPVGFPDDFSRLDEFYLELKTIAGAGVMWNGAWRDDLLHGSDAGQIPAAAAATMQSAALAGVTPIIVFGWRSDATLHLSVPDNATNDWTNLEAQELFLQMLVEFATTYRPPLVFIGNENDFYFQQNRIDYQNWVEFYETAYDTIKTISPGTEVGTVFSYEHISGAGTLAGWNVQLWGALAAHDLAKLDLVGVTVYPFFSYASPEAVPVEYLNPLVARIGLRPFAITETGWPAEEAPGINLPYEISDTSQVAYVPRLQAATQGKLVRMVNWLFLNGMRDPGGSPHSWQLFGSVSIRDSLGNKRLVYDDWVAFRP